MICDNNRNCEEDGQCTVVLGDAEATVSHEALRYGWKLGENCGLRKPPAPNSGQEWDECVLSNRKKSNRRRKETMQSESPGQEPNL